MMTVLRLLTGKPEPRFAGKRVLRRFSLFQSFIRASRVRLDTF
jgi:hypothetical protein